MKQNQLWLDLQSEKNHRPRCNVDEPMERGKERKKKEKRIKKEKRFKKEIQEWKRKKMRRIREDE